MTRDDILSAALALLDEDGAKLGMRALAARLGVTPMSLYHHVGGRADLLRALSDHVYGAVLNGAMPADGLAEIRLLLTSYHDAVARHPQLTLAIFAEPGAIAGATLIITDRLALLLSGFTPEHLLWRDILIDHVHGSALALCAARSRPQRDALRARYEQALDLMLTRVDGAR